MGLIEVDNKTRAKFQDLCMDLNMDQETENNAWQSYENISHNYTLDGDHLHWLACALYVSCQNSQLPTIDGENITGNCMSLTRLLRTAKLSLLDFFKNMKKWLDMASIPEKLREKVEKLERNFAVSRVTFTKFQPIFLAIFEAPSDRDESNKISKGRKQRRLTVSYVEIFNFCWTCYITVKGNFPGITDDLVNSYHLLLCSIDWIFGNLLMLNRRDVLNKNFSGLPKNYALRDYKMPSNPPCIINLLCDTHGGLQKEAKSIKEHYWKPYIKKLFDKKILAGKEENLTNVLDISYFDKNSKNVNNAYEEYILTIGDFDERIFFSNDSNPEIGSNLKFRCHLITDEPSPSQSADPWSSIMLRSLHPSTPLTNRSMLPSHPSDLFNSPVSNATQCVARLQTLISGRKTTPSDSLLQIFRNCPKNPEKEIVDRILEMGNIFCDKFAQDFNETSEVNSNLINFAKLRLKLAESLYYTVLEDILESELLIIKSDSKYNIILNLIEQDIVHRSLFALCIEIVLYSYNSQKTFPWIINVLEIPAYYFYKVIEIVNRTEKTLPRNIVKHLNRIEETSLESLVWKTDSPLWEALATYGKVPSVEDVLLPKQFECYNNIKIDDRIKPTTATNISNKKIINLTCITRTETLSPPRMISASSTFSSPIPVKRRLFDSVTSDGKIVTSKPTAIYVKSDGKQVAVPIKFAQSPTKLKIIEQTENSNLTSPIIRITPQNTFISNSVSSNLDVGKNTIISNKPKKSGSIPLFIRKLYYLASARLRDLCTRLALGSTQQLQIWTCFEHVLVEHTNLFKDRHLDQIIISCIYVLCKVINEEYSFHEILGYYRLQPQSASHVYRSVLIGTEPKHEDSKAVRNLTNPTTGNTISMREDRRARREREHELNEIRSSSTLPPSETMMSPTRLAGTEASFVVDQLREDRGDLIRFYNQVFVPRIKSFALKFSPKTQEAEKIILSPLPTVRNQVTSPLMVSEKHSVFVSPSREKKFTASRNSLFYQFNLSPSNNLKAINTMIKSKEIFGKCLPLTNENIDSSIGSDRYLRRKLDQIIIDRSLNNNSN